MQPDIQTQQQAQIIARDYNLTPVGSLVCDRTIPTTPIRTLFFVNPSSRVKILVKYDRDELDYP